jgi:hypothetical protein
MKPGLPAGQVNPKTGLNIGGQLDREIQANTRQQGAMLSKQLYKDRSTGMNVPGMSAPSPVNTWGSSSRASGRGRVMRQGSD